MIRIGISLRSIASEGDPLANAPPRRNNAFKMKSLICLVVLLSWMIQAFGQEESTRFRVINKPEQMSVEELLRRANEILAAEKVPLLSKEDLISRILDGVCAKENPLPPDERGRELRSFIEQLAKGKSLSLPVNIFIGDEGDEYLLVTADGKEVYVRGPCRKSVIVTIHERNPGEIAHWTQVSICTILCSKN